MTSFYSTPGPAGTIQIGEVTKGAPQSEPVVTNSGTPEAAVLNFSIPQGESGIVSAAGDGTAAAPGIAFASETGLGVYRPGAGQLALSTNGTGRLFVDASGNVSVGGNIAGGRSLTQYVRLNGDTSANYIQGVSSAGNAKPLVIEADAESSSVQIKTNTANAILFAPGGTEKARITSAGLVGIGTSSPNNLIHASLTSDTVFDPANTNTLTHVARIHNSSATTGSASSLLFQSGTALGALSLISTGTNAGDLSFSTRGGFSSTPERMRITSAGNVGIGTTSPGALLHSVVASAGVAFRGSNNNTGIDLYANDATGEARLTASRLGGSGGKFLSFYTDTGSGEFERCRITSAGLVGIGTSSPATLLHVKAASNLTTDLPFTIQNSADSLRLGIGAYGLSNTVGTSQGTDFYYNVGKDHLFQTDGNTKVVITEAGSVGIGTTSPLGSLHVRSAAAGGTDPTLANNSIFEGAGAVSVMLNGDDTSTQSIYFRDASTAGNSFRGAIRYTHTDDALALFSAGSERARIDSSGRLLIGTSTAYTSGSGVAGYFQLHGTGANSAKANFGAWSNDGSASSFYFGKSRGTLGNQVIVNSGDGLGDFFFEGSDGTKFVRAAAIQATVDGTPGANDMPGRLVFSTTPDGSASPVERMRITQDGAISTAGILTAPSATVFGTFLGRTGSAGLFETSRNVGAGVTTATIRGNAGVLNVHGDGDCENTNNSYGAISDIKLKENIADAGSQWDDLKALQVRKYNFKAETGYNTHTQIGLIAQEVELVSPGLVGETIDEETGESTKSVNYSVLYMKAVKALQEAMERIEALEAKVAALESA